MHIKSLCISLRHDMSLSFHMRSSIVPDQEEVIECLDNFAYTEIYFIYGFSWRLTFTKIVENEFLYVCYIAYFYTKKPNLNINAHMVR